MDIQRTLQIAVDTARETGAPLRDGLAEAKQIQRKSSDVDLVTQYDDRAEALITERLREHFPDHHMLAEEGGESGGGPESGGYVWYVDPLDGTSNFAHGLPIFSVSLALYEGDRPVLGVVYDPARDECFTATAGGGAHRTGPGGQSRPMHVTDADRLGDALLATGFPYDRHSSDFDNLAQFTAFLKRAQGVRRMGSAALDLCNLAAGRLDGFWEFKLHAWDVAAGRLLVEEAGGRVTDTAGNPLTLGTGRLHLIATNGRIHDQMRQVLDEVPPPAE
jgi:myo-inositol-1(or 4)-monophosphatase